MEPLERATLRPRQARYQAALRPDMKCTIHYKALPSSSLSKTKPFWPLTVPKLCQNSFLRQSALTESSLSRIHALIRRHFVCPPVDFLKSLSLAASICEYFLKVCESPCRSSRTTHSSATPPALSLVA